MKRTKFANYKHEKKTVVFLLYTLTMSKKKSRQHRVEQCVCYMFEESPDILVVIL